MRTIKLIRVTRLDSIRLDGSFFTPEGYFVDEPIVTRVGIFDYKNADGSIRRELRLPEHVFAEESLATYEGKPVIITHSAGRVDKDNVNREHVGTILTKGYRDGNDVRVRAIIHNTDAVKNVRFRELSLGYDLVLDETPGTWNGQPYDAIQTKIVVNHLALVRDARAGEQARLNMDSQNKKGATCMGDKTMNSDALKKALAEIKKQGLTNLDEAVAIVVKKLEETGDGMNTDAASGDGKPTADTDSSISPEDKAKLIKEKFDGLTADSTAPTLDGYKSDVGALLECIEYLRGRSDAEAAKSSKSDEEIKEEDKKEAPINADSVDAIISERIRLGRLGDKLNLDGLEEMKPIDAKKAIIKAVLPKMNLDGKAEPYIAAAFDQAVAEIPARKDVGFQRRQMSVRMDGLPDGVPSLESEPEKARKRMISEWKEN